MGCGVGPMFEGGCVVKKLLAAVACCGLMMMGAAQDGAVTVECTRRLGLDGQALKSLDTSSGLK
jgi:hypothetical protein